MANKVIAIDFFHNRLKRLEKKYFSLENELLALEDELIHSPQLGTALGSNLYKIRLAIKSKHRGKSGGLRVITYLLIKTKDDTFIYLITIYDKSEEASISLARLKGIINANFK